MSDKTKTFVGAYKGHKTISIHNVDPCDNPVGKYPVASFGLKKARAILKHIEDIKKFVEDSDG